MKRHLKNVALHWRKFFVALTVFAGMAAATSSLAQTVICDETTLSVSATDIKAEDLIKAVGNECGIRMVERGEVFTEDVFSVEFDDMPIRAGLERILRVVNIPNHMMRFEEATGTKRLKGIDLVGQKGGERELTTGALPEPPAPKTRPQKNAPDKTTKETDKTAIAGAKQKQADPAKAVEDPTETSQDHLSENGPEKNSEE